MTDAEVVTLCVAQSIMGIPPDPRFLAVAGKRLVHLFPQLPKRPGVYEAARDMCASFALEALVMQTGGKASREAILASISNSFPEEFARSAQSGCAAGFTVRSDTVSE